MYRGYLLIDGFFLKISISILHFRRLSKANEDLVLFDFSLLFLSLFYKYLYPRNLFITFLLYYLIKFYKIYRTFQYKLPNFFVTPTKFSFEQQK